MDVLLGSLLTISGMRMLEEPFVNPLIFSFDVVGHEPRRRCGAQLRFECDTRLGERRDLSVSRFVCADNPIVLIE
ncbi:MAG: hypothetical protein ACI9W2_000597 [Gammaproteobacteria bacterium]|jgi:hypothetical protein